MCWTVSSREVVQGKHHRATASMIFDGALASLKRFKDDVKEVASWLRVRSCIREVQRYQGRRYGGSIHDGRGTALVFCGDDLKIYVTAHKRDSHRFPELWKGSTEFSVLPLRVFRERNEIECEKTALKIQELIWKCRESSARSSAPRSRTRG